VSVVPTLRQTFIRVCADYCGVEAMIVGHCVAASGQRDDAIASSRSHSTKPTPTMTKWMPGVTLGRFVTLLGQTNEPRA